MKIGQAMAREQIPFLRVALGVLALGAVLAQFLFVPLVAAAYAAKYPELADLAQPYVVALVVAIAGFEAALVSAWQIVTLASSESDRAATKAQWAGILSVSLCFMALLFIGVFAHAGLVANVGGPPVLMGLMMSLAVAFGAIVIRKLAMRFSFAGDGVTASQ